jgi:nucleolar protein 6
MLTVMLQKKKVEKQAVSGDPDNPISSLAERPQRYSATSGLEHVPATKRTWTVGGLDDGAPHRGGQKHTKKGGKTGRPKGKIWGTGVNAIPVG